MNILYVNKYFHLVGGVERYFFDLAKLMDEKGHKVAFFSMESAENRQSRWNKYFVSNVSFSDKSIKGRIRFLSRIFYSSEAREKISRLLDSFKPDIVHLHDIYHQISPSILLEIAERNIPMVQTLGNYHLVSPNYKLFHNGKICQITKKKSYYRAILHRCIKNSYIASGVEVMEKYFHQSFINEEKLISKFIAPSNFLKEKLVEYGVSADKIITLPHFVTERKTKFKSTGSYILYFGRIEEEKGLLFLLNVLRQLPQIELRIAGKGTLSQNLKEQIKKNKIKNVKLVGFYNGKELTKQILGSRFTILPSSWFEVFGLSILESFILKRTVLASRIGGIPEVVKNNVNGMLFEPGNTSDCRKKIIKLWHGTDFRGKLEDRAYQEVQDKYSKEGHYKKMIKIYKSLIE